MKNLRLFSLLIPVMLIQQAYGVDKRQPEQKKEVAAALTAKNVLAGVTSVAALTSVAINGNKLYSDYCEGKYSKVDMNAELARNLAALTIAVYVGVHATKKLSKALNKA